WYGVYANNTLRTRISSNEVRSSYQGIWTNGGGNSAADRTLVNGNVVHNNSQGIYGQGYVTVTGNTVYGHSNNGGVGITLYYSAAATDELGANVVFDNYEGVYAYGGALVSGNRVFHNATAGINGETGATILLNQVYG